MHVILQANFVKFQLFTYNYLQAFSLSLWLAGFTAGIKHKLVLTFCSAQSFSLFTPALSINQSINQSINLFNVVRTLS